MLGKRARVAVLAIVLSGCESSSTPDKSTADAGKSTAKLGQKGGVVGSLDADGITLSVPTGALDKDATIALKPAGTAPSGYEAASPLFRFEPDGTVFKKPITITIALDRPAADAVVYFTKLGSEDFEDIGGTVSGSKITAQVSHFSRGFAAVPAAGDNPLDAGKDARMEDNPLDAGKDARVELDSGGPGATVEGCPPAGIYSLINFKCGTQDITATWKSIIPSSTLTFSTQGAACKMVLTNTSSACTEVQEDIFTFGPNGSDKSLGITSCSPDQCKFNDDDEPCVKGDGAKSSAITTSPFDVKNGRFTLRTPANSGDVCGVTEGIQVFDLDPNAKLEDGAVASAYTDNGDGTVTNAGLKLTWQQVVAQESFEWQAASTYCTSLPLAAGGWRLPTLEELLSLVDRSVSPGHVDAKFFPDSPAEQFWTSDPNGSSQHWYVDFASGLQNARSGSALRVRCARAAK